MAPKAKQPTHVVVTDTIIDQKGLVKAGTPCGESDFSKPTWRWLVQQGAVRSIKEIEAEAEANATVDETSNEQSAANSEANA